MRITEATLLHMTCISLIADAICMCVIMTAMLSSSIATAMTITFLATAVSVIGTVVCFAEYLVLTSNDIRKEKQRD